MIDPDDLLTAALQADEFSAALGLGSPEIRRVSRRDDHVELLLENWDDSILYVADLSSGPLTDRRMIRLIERWATVRNRRAGSRCYAVLAAGQIGPRQLNILRLIARTVPLLAFEMHNDAASGAVRFTPLALH